MTTNNIIWHHATVTRQCRETLHRHKGAVLWFTGLSGSGKSTLAHAVEEQLYQLGCSTFVFDGDNVRHGLCNDLGFSEEDRKENIRRIGEMTNLFLQAGTIALTAFISPFRKDRERVRKLVGEKNFVEIYCRCPIHVCEKRDVKGLYRRARAGEIKDFTGISSPYEEPETPELTVESGEKTIEACVEKIVEMLVQRGVLTVETSEVVSAL
ncbi:MAG: adenylyl-sulfate kinase [Gammaproteobacteria bacterium]|nr:adenylyl-sulfate kinase [Gammaproteobacteria bacterium]